MIGTVSPHPSPTRTRRPTTDADRARRNAQIVAARAAGRTWQSIAQEFGLSYSQVRQIVRNDRHAVESGGAGPDPALPFDPHEVFAEVVADHRDVLRRLATLADRCVNDSAAVGALRARAATGAQLLDVLARGGAAPPTPLMWRLDRDLRHLGRGMVEAVSVFEEHVAGLTVDEPVRGELLAAARRVVETFHALIGFETEHETIDVAEAA